MRWYHARDLSGSQIPVTTERFELQIPCIRSSYLTRIRYRTTEVADLCWKRGSKLKYLNTDQPLLSRSATQQHRSATPGAPNPLNLSPYGLVAYQLNIWNVKTTKNAPKFSTTLKNDFTRQISINNNVQMLIETGAKVPFFGVKEAMGLIR